MYAITVVPRPAVASGAGRPKRDNPLAELIAKANEHVLSTDYAAQIVVPGNTESKDVKQIILDMRRAAGDLGVSAVIRTENGTDGKSKKPVTLVTFYVRPAIKRPRKKDASESLPQS